MEVCLNKEGEGIENRYGKRAYLSDFRVRQPHTLRNHRAVFTSFFITSTIQGCESKSLGVGRVAGFRVRLESS